MDNVQLILSKMNMDNIWSNSDENIRALQRALKVKDDGMLGSKSIAALQRHLGIKDDGKWGSKSIGAAKNFIKNIGSQNYIQHRSMDPESDRFGIGSRLSREIAESMPTEQYNKKFIFKPSDVSRSDVSKTSSDPAVRKIIDRPELSTWTMGEDLANAQHLEGNVPDSYMPRTREGDATAKQIADEYRNQYQKYLTEDLGQGYDYKIAYYRPSLRRKPEDIYDNSKQIVADFNKRYQDATGKTEKIIPFSATEHLPGPWQPIWIGGESSASKKDFSFNPENPLSELPFWNNSDQQNYNTQLRKAIRRTPATVDVNHLTGTGQSVQELLKDRPTDQKLWGKELHIGLTQMAELESQLAETRAEIANAITPEQRKEAERKHRILSDRIALTANAETYKYNGNKVNPFPAEYAKLRDQATSAALQMGLNDEEKAQINDKLQKYYDEYGVSPYYSHMPWGERYALDHLHAAGYSYLNSEESQTPSDIFYKLHDAINGSFTPRTMSPEFTLRGDRQGVQRHLSQRGEPLATWKYNDVPVDLSGKKMDKPYFKIGEQAYDWGTGTYKVGLQTTNNYPYGDHQRNNPLFLNKGLTTNNPYFKMDLSNFDSWSDSEKQKAARWLEKNGFHTKEFGINLTDALTGQQSGFFGHNYETVGKMLKGIQDAAKNLHNPSTGMQSGDNSMYHFAMSQSSNNVSPIFGNSITGVQMIDGVPHVFNQDVYDISTGPVKMFGNETWYRNNTPISPEQWNAMLVNTK